MVLGVKQKLTLTMACLSATVLLSACAALYWSLQRNLTRESSRVAEKKARAIAEAVLRQWDEDLLVELGAKETPFSEIALAEPDWAIVRYNGEVEQGAGLFAGRIEPRARESSRLLKLDDGTIVRTFSVPLVEGRGLTFESLPEAVKSAVAMAAPQGQFLKAKREMKSDEGIYELRLLDGWVTEEIKVTSDGRVLGKNEERLPSQLPEDVTRELDEASTNLVIEPLQWKAYAGQLLAIVRIQKPGGETLQFGVNRLGERYALSENGEIVGPQEPWRLYVTAAVDARGETEAKRSLVIVLGLGTFAAWLLMTLCGWYVARKAMAPVQEIVDRVGSIELTRLRNRLPIRGVKDELSRIAATINGMLDRLEIAFDRERQFTGDAAHELRTPLAKVIAEIDLALLQPRSAEEYKDALLRCRGYAAGMQRLIESLLILARVDEQTRGVQWGFFDIEDLVVETVQGFGPEELKRIQLNLGDGEAPLLAKGERSLIGIMLHNLLENALRYSPPEKPVSIELKRSGSDIEVRVDDEGPGIPAEESSRVFERFYRLESSRSRGTGGFGLGLSIVHAIGDAHTTRVQFGTGPAGGTAAIFRLPGRSAQCTNSV